jgi:hypothetical protein
VSVGCAWPPTHGGVVGFADGGLAVTVGAGRVLVGQSAGGDTFGRGVIPVL